jgi:uncharacterized cofD-like protein
MGVKRYVALVFIGTVTFALALAMLLAYVYRTFDVPESAGWLVHVVTLQWIAHPWREVGLGALGVLVAVGGTIALFKSVLGVVIGPDEDVAEIIYQGRIRQRGPVVVSIGGGTGQGVLLRGLKEKTSNLTAVVTVADDGGSSGRLRRDFGLMPPGDIRNCLTALADSESLMTKLVHYRFEQGDGLKGHSLGNLLIAAMRDIEGGMDEGIESLSKVLRIQGNIAPSAMTDVHLAAELEDGTIVVGESEIGGRGKIKRVFLRPRHVAANEDAVSAILAADLIVIGPGSVYTSILPNLLVTGIGTALRASKAVKVYVCNVATEPGETDDFGPSDHVRVLTEHVGPGLFHYVVLNNRTDVAPTTRDGAAKILPASPREQTDLQRGGLEVVSADVIDPELPEHHDPTLLAETILQLYESASASPRVISFPDVLPGNPRR